MKPDRLDLTEHGVLRAWVTWLLICYGHDDTIQSLVSVPDHCGSHLYSDHCGSHLTCPLKCVSSCMQIMKARFRSFLSRPPVEPSPRWGQFSAVDGHHYMWRGAGPGLRGSNIIAVYDPSTELWSLLPTTGPLPPEERGGCSVCVGRCLYTFGGSDGSSYVNDMSKLDLDTLQWTKVQTSGSQPMKKAFCGLVRVNERTLCCFGGLGIEGTTQPGSTFTKSGHSDGMGWTNEFHFFDTQNGNFIKVRIRCMFSHL